MLAPFYSSPRARFFDANAKPLANGRVSFYYPSSSTLKEVYSDSFAQTPINSQQVLDAEGYVLDGGVWLGEGNYKVALEQSDGAGGYIELWTMDDIPSGSIGDAIFNNLFVEKIDDLRAIVDGGIGIAYVQGYYAKGDGGGGYFYWNDTSTDSDDGGSIIAPTGIPTQGRWVRIFGDEISVWQFGAMSTAPDFVDSQLIRAMTFASNNKRSKVVIPSDTYAVSTIFSLSGSTHLEIQEGAFFNGTGSVNIDCASLNVIGQKPLVDANVILVINPSEPIDCYADWWGDDFAVKSEGNYPARLRFNGLYSLNPSASSSHEFWLIEEGTEINVTGATGYITSIKGYLADENWNDIFNGNFTYLSVTLQSEFSINQFSGSLDSLANYTQFLIMATNNGLRSPLVNWGGYKTYSSVPSFGISSTYDLKSKVLAGSLLSFNNSCFIGKVVNNSADHIIDVNTTHFPIANNGVIYAQWLGASYYGYTDTELALKKASVWGAGLIPVSGDNSTFLFNSNTSFSTANQRERYYFIDINFETSNGTSFEFLNDVWLRNVNFNGGSASTLQLGSITSLIVVTLEDANLVATFITIRGNISARKSAFISLIGSVLNLGAGQYIACIFGDDVGGITKFESNVVDFPLRINDCFFNKKVRLNVIKDIHITNSIFNEDDQSPLSFESISYSNVIVQGNNFINRGVSSSVAGISSILSGGNVSCSVKNNNFNNCQFRSTEASFSKDILSNVSSDNLAYNLTSDWAILPTEVVSSGTTFPIAYYSSGSLNRKSGYGTDTDRYVFSMATHISNVGFAVQFVRVYNGANPIGSAGGAFFTAHIKVNDINNEVI